MPRRRQLRAILLTACWAAFLAMASASAQAADLVVDGTSIGGTCDDLRAPASVSVTTPWCSISRALSAAPDGSTVSVRAGDYPLTSVKRRPREQYVTVRPYESEVVTAAGLTMEDSSHIRVEDLRFMGRVTVGVGSQHIQLIGNDITGQGVSMRVARDVLIEGNRIHDLTYEGASGGAGYGIWMTGSWSDPARTPGIFDVVIKDNLFERIPADAIQMGAVDGVRIEGNEFTKISPFLDPTEHSDSIQMYGTAKNVTIRRNNFHDTTHGVIAKGYSYPGLIIENNLMVRMPGTALNIYDAPGVRIVNNTVWDVEIALRFNDLAEVPAAMEQATVANNILQSFYFGTGQVAYEDYNLIGQRSDARTYGPHDYLGAPIFRSPVALDYGLTSDSPGVDSANGDLASATDYLVRPRADIASVANLGSGVPAFGDIGAFETQTAPSAAEPEPTPAPEPVRPKPGRGSKAKL